MLAKGVGAMKCAVPEIVKSAARPIRQRSVLITRACPIARPSTFRGPGANASARCASLVSECSENDRRDGERTTGGGRPGGDNRRRHDV